MRTFLDLEWAPIGTRRPAAAPRTPPRSPPHVVRQGYAEELAAALGGAWSDSDEEPPEKDKWWEGKRHNTNIEKEESPKSAPDNEADMEFYRAQGLDASNQPAKVFYSELEVELDGCVEVDGQIMDAPHVAYNGPLVYCVVLAQSVLCLVDT